MNLQGSHWGPYWLYPAWWVLQHTALVFFLCWNLCLFSLVLPLWHCSSIRNNNPPPTHQDCSDSALHHTCHHWAPSAASVSQPATSTTPAGDDISDDGCSPPALTVWVQAGPRGGGKHGHGKFCKVPHITLTLRSEVRVPEAAGCCSLPSWLMGARGSAVCWSYRKGPGATTGLLVGIEMLAIQIMMRNRRRKENVDFNLFFYFLRKQEKI